MADDEQFSLCWNNFNSNLSAGFHESLCRGDLVDVTLAAEGQFVKAHRLVLSVCSPYFRKMFTQMPANQHAFVFLKDVSHTALKDLIQFMYCGEVNVKQEALPAFISTAEALQIKGLTDSDPPPSQSPAEPSTPTPQVQQISSPRVRQRSSTARSYKLETVDDSGDDNKQPTQIVIQTSAPAPQTTIAQQTQHLQPQSHQSQHTAQQLGSAGTTAPTIATQKRSAQRNSSGAPHIKRTKSTIDPLDTDTTGTTPPQTQQITVQSAVVTAESKTHLQQQQSETEYIDLPIELPTKSEPDYTEDAGEVESAEPDATYVEDDSYGELRYDESYFTENEDAAANTTGGAAAVGSATTSKAIVKQQQTSFSDSSYVETSDHANSDAQDTIIKYKEVLVDEISDEPLDISSVDNQGPNYVVSKYGTRQLVLKQHTFNRHVCREDVTYWRCSQFAVLRCRARIKTKGNILTVLNGDHNHEVITKTRKYGSLKHTKLEALALAHAQAQEFIGRNDIQ